MNFLKKKSFFLFIFLEINIFSFENIISQKTNPGLVAGSPIVQTFHFPDNYLASDKISVYEDPQGYFLLGSQNQLILFYGNEFLNIPLKGQVNVISNFPSVFYTAKSTMGIVKFYKNSLPQLIPLFDYSSTSSHFGQINSVYLVDNYLIFNNNNKLFSTIDGSSIEVIDSSTNFIQLFRVNDTVYTYKPEFGLSKIIEGKIIPYCQDKLLKNQTISFILSYNKGLLIKLTGSSEFYFLRNNILKPIALGFENITRKTGINEIIVLPDNQFIIATQSAGIIIYNPIFNDIRRIRVSEGLLDNTILNLHLDKDLNLWAFHKSGVSRIELGSSVSVFGYESGLTGSIMDITKFNNLLWVATTNGLFHQNRIQQGSGKRLNNIYFEPVPEVISKCFRLKVLNNKLLVFSPSGVYSISTKNEVSSFQNIEMNGIDWDLHNNNFFIATQNGILQTCFKNNSLQPQDTILKNIAIEQLSWFNDQLWFKTLDQQAGRIAINDVTRKGHYSTIFFNIKEEEKNLPFFLLKTYDGIKFCFPSQIKIYDEKRNALINQHVNLPVQLEEIPFAVELFSDSNKKWYSVAGKLENQKGILVFNTDRKSKNNSRPYFFRTESTNSPIFMDSSMIWIGGKEKIFCYNRAETFLPKNNFITIIKRVIIGKDSILRIQLEDPEIKYRYNDLKFIVSSTSFESEPFVRYQYRLLGQSNSWSPWTQNTTIAYNKLSPGSYIFQIRALDINGTISEITELNFSILHPFYSTMPAYILYLLIALFLIFVFFRYRTWRFLKKKQEIDEIVQKRTAEIIKEKEKSEQLIENILPKATAEEIKQTGKATSQKFSMVTVLFSDIQGFTKIAEQMNPEMLIDQLDSFFFHFDSVIEKYNIEKIKTIGDAYMCAGGIPDKNITNPVEVVLAALEMTSYMDDLKSKNVNIWDLRIGIHTGSVIAGVVGHKKLSYDIWGDTVNTASRMESSGEPGKINISGQTYELVKDFFECEYRGKMPVKYKGEIDMYFVKGIRSELSAGSPYVPNEKFFLKLQLLRIEDIKEYVIDQLKERLPEKIYFHSAKHQEDIYNLVGEYCTAENLNLEQTLLTKTAALFMDTGFMFSYEDHESRSIEFARETLPKYKYNEHQIDEIVKLIDSTRGMRKPDNILEQILVDAEMSYLTQSDFAVLNELYFRESFEHQKISTWEEWVKMQVVILTNHKYYTQVANAHRQVNPEKQIELLMKTISS
jgi:class 3 adenylate cyclase